MLPPIEPPDPELVQRIREALAKRKYAETMSDARFDHEPGVIVWFLKPDPK